MDTILQILALVVVIGIVAVGRRRFNYSEPLVLVVVGVGFSFIPGLLDIHITPELVLYGFLPPLLYAAAIRTPILQFKANRRAIVLLSVGAVVFTTFALGLTVWALVPSVTFAAGCALGAVIAPPDAVSATTIGRRVGMPRKVVSILEGESLVNDATALVALSTAIAAMTAAVHVSTIAWGFVWAAGGGLLIGGVIALVLVLIRRYLKDPVLDTTLSFAAPYIAFVPAELLGSSGVLAVVVTGLILGHGAPYVQSASARLAEVINWRTVQFLLENVVFLLIGLQLKDLVTAVNQDTLPWLTVIPVCLALLLATILARFVYIFFGSVQLRLAHHNPWTWAESTIVSWAGMRGVVTLAAVFVIPADTPHRAMFAFAAFTVVAGTLVLQGTTLPWLVRRFRLVGPDPVEDALQLASLTSATAQVGLARLAEVQQSTDPVSVITQLQERAAGRVNHVWERLGPSYTESEPPSVTYRRLRLQMLAAERDHLLSTRSQGSYDEEVLRSALAAIDVEESMLDDIEDITAMAHETEASRDSQFGDHQPGEIQPSEIQPSEIQPSEIQPSEIQPSEIQPSGNQPDGTQLGDIQSGKIQSGGCEHLRIVPSAVNALTPEGCEECLRDGSRWVHLRLCLECGHVGCCDSSTNKHAQGHFHQTQHPVIRSFESGEMWRWCYIDTLLA